ncbi:uncharacterized protein LOC34624356 [Cyclospora cayetanensis]|uniref:Uncharacterized protein LOC34624356 n=1 Tax=Cyclospora cayetanensis TaxID=88456 RepID=A0A6P6S1R1_9EIME|nr:uncharacterized protein LOC34624356 [Cyclospora cayetanensis]
MKGLPHTGDPALRACDVGNETPNCSASVLPRVLSVIVELFGFVPFENLPLKNHGNPRRWSPLLYAARSSASESHESRGLSRRWSSAVTPAAAAAAFEVVAPAAAETPAAVDAEASAAAAMELPDVPAEFDAIADDFISALGPNEERSKVRAEAFQHLRDAIFEAFTDFRLSLQQQQQQQQQLEGRQALQLQEQYPETRQEGTAAERSVQEAPSHNRPSSLGGSAIITLPPEAPVSSSRTRHDSPSSFFSVSSSPSPTAAGGASAAVPAGAATEAAAAACRRQAAVTSTHEPEEAAGISSPSPGIAEGSTSGSACSSSVRCLSDICVAVHRYGSFPLLTYLPDGDLDVGVLTFSPKTGVVESEEDSEAFLVYLYQRFRRGDLRVEGGEPTSEFSQSVCTPGESQRPAGRGLRGPRIRNVHLVKADVKIIKLEVDGLAVDLSVNKVGGCCSLALLELLDRRIGRCHLFKRSVILVKAWMAYESHLLGSRSGLLASYCLEVLVLHLFSCLPPSSLQTPLQVFRAFLSYFSNFDWASFAATVAGPLPLWLLRYANRQQQQQQQQQRYVEPQHELLHLCEHSSGNPQDGDPRLERLAFIAQHMHPEEGASRDGMTNQICKAIADLAFIEECRRRFRMCYGGMGGGGLSRFSGGPRSSFVWADPASPTAAFVSSSGSSGRDVPAPASSPASRWAQSSSWAGGSNAAVNPRSLRGSPPIFGCGGVFVMRCINVVDPLLNCNNLGRSVSEPAFVRLTDALKRGNATLKAVLQRGDQAAFRSVFFRNSYRYLQRLRRKQTEQLQPQIKPLVLLRISTEDEEERHAGMRGGVDGGATCSPRDSYTDFLTVVHTLKEEEGAASGNVEGPLGASGNPPLVDRKAQRGSSTGDGDGSAKAAAKAFKEGETAFGCDSEVGEYPSRQRQQPQPTLQLDEEEMRSLLALCQLLSKQGSSEGPQGGPGGSNAQIGEAHYACSALNAYGDPLCACKHSVSGPLPSATDDAGQTAPPSNSSDASGCGRDEANGGLVGSGGLWGPGGALLSGASEAAMLPIEAAAAAEAAIAMQSLLPFCTRGCRRNSSAGSYSLDTRTAGGPSSVGSPRSACSLGRLPWETRGGNQRLGVEGGPRGPRGPLNDRYRRPHPQSVGRQRAGVSRSTMQQQTPQFVMQQQQQSQLYSLPPSRDPYWQGPGLFAGRTSLLGPPMEGPSPAPGGGGPVESRPWQGDGSGSPSVACCAAADDSSAGNRNRGRVQGGSAGPPGTDTQSAYPPGRFTSALSHAVATLQQQQHHQQQSQRTGSSSLASDAGVSHNQDTQRPSRRPSGWGPGTPPTSSSGQQGDSKSFFKASRQQAGAAACMPGPREGPERGPSGAPGGGSSSEAGVDGSPPYRGPRRGSADSAFVTIGGNGRSPQYREMPLSQRGFPQLPEARSPQWGHRGGFRGVNNMLSTGWPPQQSPQGAPLPRSVAVSSARSFRAVDTANAGLQGVGPHVYAVSSKAPVSGQADRKEYRRQPPAAAAQAASLGSASRCTQQANGGGSEGTPQGSAVVRKATPQWGASSFAVATPEQLFGRGETSRERIGNSPVALRANNNAVPINGAAPQLQGAVSRLRGPPHVHEQQRRHHLRESSSSTPSRDSWAGDSTGVWRVILPQATASAVGGPADGHSGAAWGPPTSPRPEGCHFSKLNEFSSLPGDLLSLRSADVQRLSAADRAKALQATQQQLAALQDAVEWQTATSKRERKRASASGRDAESKLAQLLAVQQVSCTKLATPLSFLPPFALLPCP